MVLSLLSQAYAGIHLRPIDGPTPCRDVFALVPPGAGAPFADDVVRALRATAGEFTAPA